ncbi:hypothetical protein E2562_010892 [Oryza meyeriana var. granulata]|uniref:Uncharacterized protein n=1 Tax=Oryza meyeriana var. granulata TaxID=110450 RepID=A0A6G1BTK9_9ORYZ|nr:hypothetical protein E2562_010892 [Oryza meyeriana var. granulata]
MDVRRPRAFDRTPPPDTSPRAVTRNRQVTSGQSGPSGLYPHMSRANPSRRMVEASAYKYPRLAHARANPSIPRFHVVAAAPVGCHSGVSTNAASPAALHGQRRQRSRRRRGRQQ